MNVCLVNLPLRLAILRKSIKAPLYYVAFELDLLQGELLLSFFSQVQLERPYKVSLACLCDRFLRVGTYTFHLKVCFLAHLPFS